MSDRLAAMRAQGQGSYQNNSYNSSGGGYGGGGGGGGGGGYQSRRPNPYAQGDDSNRYEMSAVNTGSNYGNNSGYGGGYSAPAAAPTGGVDMNAFWAEVSDVQNTLRTYNDNVAHISDLHARSLNNMGDSSVQDQLERAIDQARTLSNDLKRRIKALQAQGGESREGQQRRQQAALLKTKFQEAIQNYQQVEQRHRGAQKQRMERQYRIVNPQATPEEVRAVVEDDNPGQIFQQALMNSNRLGESRAAYREVQERHQDIQKIEQTIAELAQLFNDMAILVEEQGEQVTHIEKTTETVQQDTEVGFTHTEKAKESARSARKKRWICFWIVVVILIIVAIVIGVQVAQGNIGGGGGGNNNNNPSTVTVTSAPPAATTGTGGAVPPPAPVSAKFRL